MTDARLQAALPLSRSLLHLLMAIREGERHGYAVMKWVEDHSGGVVRMGPGTLYTTIQRAESLGLVVEADPPGDAPSHAQRRYYDLTPLGLRALTSEVDRLGAFVDRARAALSDGA
jgi:DNA-binding PadR family transcriptional regulator